MSSLWTIFLEPWVHATSIALPLARVAHHSSFSSVLLVASNEGLEKKLLSSLSRYVACCEGCEPRCSRGEGVCVPLLFTLRRLCLAQRPTLRGGGREA
jgi:hypothetical protein